MHGEHPMTPHVKFRDEFIAMKVEDAIKLKHLPGREEDSFEL